MINDNALSYHRQPRLERGLSRHDVAAVLGYNYTTICRMVKAGEFETYGRGRKLRIYESSVERYRQRTRNMIQKNNPVHETLRRTSARHKEAMLELEKLLH